MTDTNRFRHESLHDTKSIADLLKAITQGIAKGKITFQDDDAVLNLTPEGMLRLKVTAQREDGQNKIDLRISWQEEVDLPKGKTLKITSK